MKRIANYVKTRREKINLTQMELARRAGVGVRFLRELENGKETVRCDAVNKVLAFFGCELAPQKVTFDEPSAADLQD